MLDNYDTTRYTIHISNTQMDKKCQNVKKQHQCCTLQLQRTSTDFGNFWQKYCWV